MPREYRYVGPAQIRASAAGAAPGARIASADDLARWAAAHAGEAEGDVLPATFVVMLDGSLRLAPRRSEHVACATGQPVLSAGELFIRRGPPPYVAEASNLSTGYCPEPQSWSAVARALDAAGISHPGRFTGALVFRRCPGCGERNLVKDGFFACAICGADLPSVWNFDRD